MPKIRLAPWQFVAINNQFQHFALLGGVASGKSYTGAHWVIDKIVKFPDVTGFVGANVFDQLTQATLRELFYWLEHYGFDFVIDRMPPDEWNCKRSFKSYKNILLVKNKATKKVTTIFTRVLAKGENLRGIEFTWYWIDETRDTPQNTHEIILSRLRESTWTAGLVTTTTNGEDWVYNRFVKPGRDQTLYGYCKVKTIESVHAGIITQNYYDTMRASYSEMLALQELDAEHVNVMGGRAYYASNMHNRTHVAPWGDRYPNPKRPLIIGCDFNFAPAPCVWMVGQVGSNEWSRHIHWFGEIAKAEASTRSMAQIVLAQYPDFFYRVFGDRSGNIGTTSNAGDHDYNQIADEFVKGGALFTIDVDQNNPLVRDRVENMNAMFKNSLGEIRQTYNPDTCPLFDADLRMVGWKMTIQKGKGRLDDGGDKQRTHASDGAGYAVWKLFPPGRTLEIIPSNPSQVRSHL